MNKHFLGGHTLMGFTLSMRKLLLIGFGLVFILLGIFLLRGCSENGFSKNKTYTVAVDSSWQPLQMIGREKNLLGFTTDLLRAISREASFRSRIVEVAPMIIREGLDEKRFDAMISPLTPSVVTEKFYSFSDPYYLFGPVLIVKSDSKITKPEDLDGKIIGITTKEANLFVKYPSLLVVTYETITSAMEQLVKNQIDAVILEAVPAYVMTQGSYAGRLKVITSPLTDQGLRVVTINDPEHLILVSRFNEGLTTLLEDGTYERLIKKWGLIDPVMK